MPALLLLTAKVASCRIRRKVALPSAVILLSTAFAAPLLSQHNKTSRSSGIRLLVQQIFELDGTNEALQNVVAVYRADLQRNPSKVSPAEIAAARQWVQLMFDTPEFPEAYYHGFMENLDERYARSTLEWLRSVETRRIHELTRVLRTPEGLAGLNPFLNSPEGRRQSETRKAVLRHYSDVTNCAETSLRTVVGTALMIEAVRNRFRAPNEKLAENDFRKIETSLRQQHSEGIANGCWMPLLYAYRAVRDEELRRHLAFYETNAGKWYTKAHQAAKSHAWASGAMRVGQAGYDWPPSSGQKPK
ncbi:MAG TPA: hypothetical protein VGK99_17840 [Acidobacteriota bacterium]|jgi:hypothetical protein